MITVIRGADKPSPPPYLYKYGTARATNWLDLDRMTKYNMASVVQNRQNNNRLHYHICMGGIIILNTFLAHDIKITTNSYISYCSVCFNAFACCSECSIQWVECRPAPITLQTWRHIKYQNYRYAKFISFSFLNLL